MTNLKLSSKMHIMIIVSVIVLAVGVAMGLVFQFISNGYFNYGEEYSSYNSVVVDYAYMEFNNKDILDNDSVKEICDTAFENAGVRYYTSVYGENNQGGEITFKFSTSVNAESIQSAVKAIQSKLDERSEITLSTASFHEEQTVMGGSKNLIFGAIALASAVVFQFIYFAIRYKLSMAFSALLANVHNLAIFVSLLSITRIPLGASAVAFGALTVVLTMIGCCFLFGRMRKNFKNEDLAKLDAFGQVDLSATESRKNIIIANVCVAIAAIVLFVFMAISSLALEIIISPVVMALLSVVASLYGTLFFTPAVYSRFKRIGDNYKAAHSKKAAKNS